MGANTAQASQPENENTQVDTAQDIPEQASIRNAFAGMGVVYDDDELSPVAADAEEQPDEDDSLADIAAAGENDYEDVADEIDADELEASADDESEDADTGLPVEIDDDGRVVVRSDDAVLVDPDGNEWKASDVIWRTQQYHKKLAEKDREVKEVQDKLNVIDEQFNLDRGGFGARVLLATDPAERLHAIATVLDQSGLGDIAESVKEVAERGGLRFDPLEPERRKLESEKEKIEREKKEAEERARREAAQAALLRDLEALQDDLGRALTRREAELMDEVFEAHALRNPDKPLSVRQAYEKAARLLRIEEAERREKQKKRKPRASTVEPASQTPKEDDSVIDSSRRVFDFWLST